VNKEGKGGNPSPLFLRLLAWFDSVSWLAYIILRAAAVAMVAALIYYLVAS
jgi:hypothetical protein